MFEVYNRCGNNYPTILQTEGIKKREMQTRTLRFIRLKHTPFGGAERYLERLESSLKKEGYQTEILHAQLPKGLPSWLKVLLFDRQICREKSSLHPPRSILYFSLDRISCPDIYRAGDGVHKAFLETKGFTLNPLHLSYLYLEKRTFENARCIIANSRLVKEQILRHYPRIDERKIHIVYNGVPLPGSFDKLRAKKALAEELAFDPDRPILLFVGSGFERKGVREFLQIVSRLRHPIQALIVGKEKRIGRYKKLAEELGISDHVLFCGPRRDVERFYEAADLFLFPTRYEPFSNVVLEALSYENIVLTTRQNGASEILPQEWIMQSPEDFGVASRIDQLLEEPLLMQQASKTAGEIARRHPLERNVRETLELIQKQFG